MLMHRKLIFWNRREEIFLENTVIVWFDRILLDLPVYMSMLLFSITLILFRLLQVSPFNGKMNALNEVSVFADVQIICLCHVVIEIVHFITTALRLSNYLYCKCYQRRFAF